MKLPIVAAIAASAALVSASPLRVVVVSSAIERPDAAGLVPVRLGHSAAAVNPNVAQIMAPGGAQAAQYRRPCGGRSRFREKALEISNTFRKAFGFPLIEPEHAIPHDKAIHGGMIQIMPLVGTPTRVEVKGPSGQGWWGKTKGGDRVQILAPLPLEPGHPGPGRRPPPRPHHRYHHHHHLHHHQDSFLMRVQTAIVSLGPWEGRAVAFVLGCGIGVLLRMFWVLGVVAYRGCNGEADQEYTTVAVFDHDDDDETPRGTPISAPPTYVYPIDEKMAFSAAVRTEDGKPTDSN